MKSVDTISVTVSDFHSKGFLSSFCMFCETITWRSMPRAFVTPAETLLFKRRAEFVFMKLKSNDFFDEKY